MDDLENLLMICKRYARLGWSVQEQLDTIVADGGLIDEQNPNALDMIIRDFLRPLDRDHLNFAGAKDNAEDLIAAIMERGEGDGEEY